ncbi:hypothetical protein ILUMI_16128 [Ignelater luminosus]|uniref:Uncharacterized protein n=1 Tax=Ignelater luminosus TaxID=2038154 RepID=A0A8K0CME9_IGNLU|nr:hypothetical protein ILUMI_16128 [Ignelater luminosus]
MKSNVTVAKLVLLNSVGAENYEILKLKISPRQYANLIYDEVVKYLKEELSPKSDIVVERHRFLSQKQVPEETINEYVANLRKFLANYHFQCNSDFNKILKKAQAIEASKLDNKEIFSTYGSSSSTNTSIDVNHVSESQLREKVKKNFLHSRTLLPKAQFEKLQLDNKPQFTEIRSYTTKVIDQLGIVEVQVRYNGKKSTEIMFVVPDNILPILGRS